MWGFSRVSTTGRVLRAARAATQVGFRRGWGAAELEESERAELRALALAWLRGVLEEHRPYLTNTWKQLRRPGIPVGDKVIEWPFLPRTPGHA